MEPIPLSELPRYSPWPARLLGLEPWSRVERRIEHVDAEYEQDKYARVLDYCERTPGASFEDVLWHSIGEPREAPLCVAAGEKLLLTTMGEAFAREHAVVLEALVPLLRRGDAVVELGSGFGPNLHRLREAFPDASYLGGDYSGNAVRVASLVHGGGIAVERLDLYDDAYPLLERAAGELVVFSSHALEQVQDVGHVLDVLGAQRERIRSVVHFEPAYDLYGDTLLGLLRRRYAEVNDYNRELLAELRARPEVELVRVEPNVFGINPLHPRSVIEWRFRGR